MIDLSMLEAAFILFFTGLLGLSFIIIVGGVVVYFGDHHKQRSEQAKWLKQRQQKKVIDILNPSSASRRKLNPQVSAATKNGAQEAEGEVWASLKQIINIGQE